MDKEKDFREFLLREYRNTEILLKEIKSKRNDLHDKLLKEGVCPKCGSQLSEKETAHKLVTLSSCECGFQWCWMKSLIK